MFAQCQKVSIEQCEICAGVLPRRRCQSPSVPVNQPGGNVRATSHNSSPGGIGQSNFHDHQSSHMSHFELGQHMGAGGVTGNMQRLADDGTDLGVLQEAIMASHASLPAGFRGMPDLEVLQRQSEDEKMARAIQSLQLEEETKQRTHLLEQQDQEYQESLRIDRQREEERQQKQQEQERKLEEEEQKRKEEEEAKVAAEQEQKSRQVRMMVLIEEARARLGEAPSKGDPDCISLLVRTPEGKALRRAFRRSDPVSKIYDYCIAEGGETLAFQEFRLITTMPRQVYDDRAVTLEAAGLQGQCALLVEIIGSVESN